MEFVKKHLLTILCAVCLVLLLLPIAEITSVIKTEIMGTSTESKATTSITGLSAAGSNMFAYLMIVGPILLVAMNYIKQLDKYKSLLSVIVPAVCLVGLIIVLLQCGSVNAKASNSAASAEVTVTWSIGAYLLILAYIGTAIAGGVTYYGLRFDKESLEKMKSGATGFVNMAQEKIGGMAENIHIGGQTTDGAPQAAAKPANSLKRTEDVLALLEKLNEMKERGILSEEEFSKKKQQLLEEI